MEGDQDDIDEDKERDKVLETSVFESIKFMFPSWEESPRGWPWTRTRPISNSSKTGAIQSFKCAWDSI